MEKINLIEWNRKFENGDFNFVDVKTQIKAGWYDWFCKDSSLLNKTLKMGKIINKIVNGGKLNFERTYVWFKNNCPLNGGLYDDFRFADLATGQVLYTVQIDCCWNEEKYVVYGRKQVDQEFSTEPLFKTNSVKELIKYFNTKE